MVCNTQDYWAFGLCPSPTILKNTKQHISKTGPVSETIKTHKSARETETRERECDSSCAAARAQLRGNTADKVLKIIKCHSQYKI
jgi:hypothetical protein